MYWCTPYIEAIGSLILQTNHLVGFWKWQPPVLSKLNRRPMSGHRIRARFNLKLNVKDQREKGFCKYKGERSGEKERAQSFIKLHGIRRPVTPAIGSHSSSPALRLEKESNILLLFLQRKAGDLFGKDGL
nr:hypothetical protein Iba_chr14bCG11870 [Ipomoea batatas]